MLRILCLSIAAVLSLSAVASAAPVHKRPAKVWKGYGFLPGYHQPLNNAAPLFRQSTADLLRAPRRSRRPWYIDPTPHYYDWTGEARYPGRPGFGGGRYNGGSFGPCWTRTPAGAAWTCG
jgi:hypothetical protein